MTGRKTHRAVPRHGKPCQTQGTTSDRERAKQAHRQPRPDYVPEGAIESFSRLEKDHAVSGSLPSIRRLDAVVETNSWSLDRDNIDVVRAYASRGVLAHRIASASTPQRRDLVAAVYEVVWPVVFSRLTRILELRSGHAVCSRSVGGG